MDHTIFHGRSSRTAPLSVPLTHHWSLLALLPSHLKCRWEHHRMVTEPVCLPELHKLCDGGSREGPRKCSNHNDALHSVFETQEEAVVVNVSVIIVISSINGQITLSFTTLVLIPQRRQEQAEGPKGCGGPYSGAQRSPAGAP